MAHVDEIGLLCCCALCKGDGFVQALVGRVWKMSQRIDDERLYAP